MTQVDACINKFFEQTNWSFNRQYSSITSFSREILNFTAPQGFAATVHKSTSDVLDTCYTVGLPTSGSVGLLFTSVPLDQQTKASLQSTKINLIQDVNSSYLMYGKMLRNSQLDYYFARRLSLNTLFTMFGTSTWHPGSSFVNYIVSTDRKTWGHEFCFSSSNSMFGSRWLRQITPSVSVGGELYYLAADVSGGASLGGKYESDVFTSTITINPLLGHVSCSYSSGIAPNLNASCRYNYNLYSYESDLAVGFAYQHGSSHGPLSRGSEQVTAQPSKQIADGRLNTLLRLKFTSPTGLSLLFQQDWDYFTLKFGVTALGKHVGIGLELGYLL